jgi:Tol biopolymer transport system component
MTGKIRIAVAFAVGLSLVVADASSASTIAWSQFAGNGLRARIVSAQPDGTGLRTVSHPDKHFYDIDPAISPDGGEVAFERDDNKTGTSAIGIAEADGSAEDVLDLGCDDPCAADLTPGWLPGGERITFTSVVGPFDLPGETAHSAVLYTANPDGSDVERLSEPGIDSVYEDYHARWAPDGSYYIFTRVRNEGFKIATFRADPDGSNAQRLTPWHLGSDLPDISLATSGPTEDLIVFETYGTGAPKGETQNVATVPADCTSVSECRDAIRYVTHRGAGKVASFNPTWSPDGSEIAFVHYKDQGPDQIPTGDIWTVGADGTGKHVVSDSPRFDFRPDWGPTAP